MSTQSLQSLGNFPHRDPQPVVAYSRSAPPLCQGNCFHIQCKAAKVQPGASVPCTTGVTVGLYAMQGREVIGWGPITTLRPCSTHKIIEDSYKLWTVPSTTASTTEFYLSCIFMSSLPFLCLCTLSLFLHFSCPDFQFPHNPMRVQITYQSSIAA